MNLDTITHYTNTINNYLELRPNPERNNKVSFLDLAIIRNTSHLQIDIFRKPTTTNTTISYLSNHPQEQKLEWMANYPAYRHKQSLPHRPDPQPKTPHGKEKNTTPSPPLSPHIQGRTKNGPCSTSGRSLTIQTNSCKNSFQREKHTRTPSQNNKHYKNTNTQQTNWHAAHVT